MMYKRITVFCASSNSIHADYLGCAREMGRLLALAGHEIIFGAGNVGMMNSLAEGALSENGFIKGVIPRFMEGKKLSHRRLSSKVVVEGMHEREAIMLKEADAIIALPGGTGTFSELIQAITWKQLGLIVCPIIIVNFNDYFEPLIAMYRKAAEENFIHREYLGLWLVTGTPLEASQFLKYPWV